MRNSERDANEDMRLVPTERERWIQVLSKNPRNTASHDAEDARFDGKLFAAAARVKAKQPAIVPAGWQLVPIEPTQAMLDQADKTVQPVFSIGGVTSSDHTQGHAADFVAPGRFPND